MDHYVVLFQHSIGEKPIVYQDPNFRAPALYIILNSHTALLFISRVVTKLLSLERIR